MGKINLDIIAPFVNATEKTFTSMVGTAVRRVEAYEKKNCVMFGDISGVIGISGNVVGTAAISFPVATAVYAIESMIGESVDGGVEDATVQDGVGELINLVAGNAKATLGEAGLRFNISLPTIISGPSHELYHRSDVQCVGVRFETECGKAFTVEVCVCETK